MLTTTSLFEELTRKEFGSYKELLECVRNLFEQNVGRLPSEIGPRDLVARASSLGWIRQTDRSITIVLRKSKPKATTGATQPRRSMSTTRARSESAGKLVASR
jgi:hypothetical protein